MVVAYWQRKSRVKFIIAVLMFVGLIGTVIPRIPGTVIIVSAVLLYGITESFANFELWLIASLISLTVLAETGGRWIRIRLTQRYPLSRKFSVNAFAGNIAGIVVTDVLFGRTGGFILWQLIAGKIFYPRWDMVSTILSGLITAAAFRFFCGIMMIILVVIYIF